jgi:hypothetical protein
MRRRSPYGAASERERGRNQLLSPMERLALANARREEQRREAEAKARKAFGIEPDDHEQEDEQR